MENNDFRDFLNRYRGAIIGALVALLALIVNLHIVLLWIAVIIFGMYAGNYVQHNKEFVKDKLKYFIDKL